MATAALTIRTKMMTTRMTDVSDCLPLLESWLRTRARCTPRPFGTASGRYQGFSDDARGVQWNTGIDRQRGVVTVGVNLEGMKYDNWPIATFLLQERVRPDLPGVLRQSAGADRLEVWLERDCWQAAARLPISESFIGPEPPLAVSRLSDPYWADMIARALECLDASRAHRGRGRQEVTLLRSGKVEKDVSPHLQVKYVLPSASVSIVALETAALALEPVYAYIRARCNDERIAAGRRS